MTRGPARSVALVIVLVAALATIVPVLSVIAISFQGSQAGIQGITSLFSHGLQAGAYVQVLTGAYIRSVGNSLIVGTASTALALFLTLPAAFFASRRQGRLFTNSLVFNYVIRGIPGLLFLLPIYVVLRTLGWLNTYLGMALSYQILLVPTMMGLLMPFFRAIPTEIYEAAEIDGARLWSVFTRLALPLAKGALIAAAVLGFVTSWNEFVFALVFTGPATITAPVDILNFLQYETVQWAPLAAGAVVLMVPGFIVGSFAGRYLVRGFGAAYS